MSLRRLLVVLSGSLLLSGCLYNAREHTDRMVCDLAAHPVDLTAEQTPPANQTPGSKPLLPAPDVQTSAILLANAQSPPPLGPIRQVAFQGAPGASAKDLEVPKNLPGADAPPIPRKLDPDPAKAEQQLRMLYGDLPPLPKIPQAQPGPQGQPYTLADLQQIAAGNSPTLRQAASDVEAARGNLIAAAAYPNPTLGFQIQPSNDGRSSAAEGFYVDQLIKTGGKLRYAAASSLKDLENAELALKRARSDLATQVRNAYFALLVAEEAMRVNYALARFTDDVFRIQIGLTRSGAGAPYEPAPLRAQAYTVRLALHLAIQNYEYSWKQLVAVLGERQLPLSQVAGRIDTAIPYYDYDAVLAHVLTHHTDVLTARNGIDKARANLKLQQVMITPDVDVQVGVFKDFGASPELFYQTVQLAVPIPVWDQNKGGILAAEAALVRATEEPHRVETNLTNNFANAYNNYTNALASLEYYRRYILPDLVRTYQSTYNRRYVGGDIQGVVFGDIVAAQQNLVTNVGTYLTVLGQLWTSVTGVADFLQTDNLFQLGEPMGLPALPDFEHLPAWPCCHPCGEVSGCPAAEPGAANPVAGRPGDALPGVAKSAGTAPAPKGLSLAPVLGASSAGTAKAGPTESDAGSPPPPPPPSPPSPAPLSPTLRSEVLGPVPPPPTTAPAAMAPVPRPVPSSLDVLMDRLPPNP